MPHRTGLVALALRFVFPAPTMPPVPFEWHGVLPIWRRPGYVGSVVACPARTAFVEWLPPPACQHCLSRHFLDPGQASCSAGPRRSPPRACAHHQHPLHEISIPYRPYEVSEHVPHLERSVQSLTDESARILHALRHGEAIDGGDDAQKVLGALQQSEGVARRTRLESLDGVVESAELLWT